MVRESWGLPLCGEPAKTENESIQVQGGEMDEVDDIIDNLSAETDSKDA